MKNLKKKKTIRIRVTYLSKELQRFTKKIKEIIQMPIGSRSGDFLDFLQERYPQIFEKYGPGYLGFERNGKRPNVLTFLKDGDHYEFTSWTKKEIIQDELAQRFKETGAVIELPKGEFKMPKWMECAWRRVACGKDDCPICGKIKKDRQKHIEKGEDPDDIKSVLEDVKQNFKETLEMIKKDCEARGIELTNIENIKEPPEPEEFPLYQEIKRWNREIFQTANEAELFGNWWIYTEAAANLFWYANTLLSKVYRQFCNRWHIENKDEYGEFDYQYTRYVLKECLKILKNSLKELVSNNYLQKRELDSIYSNLLKLEKQINKI